MKNLGKKGQGAMEYLMTYGWAILVVMIVGVVLWQLGIFGGAGGGVNTATGFSKMKVMEPSSKYTTTGTLSFVLMNGDTFNGQEDYSACHPTTQQRACQCIPGWGICVWIGTDRSCKAEKGTAFNRC